MGCRVCVVFSHPSPDVPTWPYKGYDYEARKKELMNLLKKELPDFDITFKTAMNSKDGEKIVKELGDVDGYVVYMLGIWVGAGYAIASTGKPTILVDDLYCGSGELISTYAWARSRNLPVLAVASSKFEDVVKALSLIRVLTLIKGSKVIVVTDGDVSKISEAIKNSLGVEVLKVSSERLNRYYREANVEEAEKWADKWMREALRVMEPSKDEIVKAARMYLAMKKLLEENEAIAIAVDCLTLVYSNRLEAYPCLGFFQLNNEGLIGACEADLSSTLAMLIIKHLTGEPSFISDPVFDLSKRWIVYAHCVAPSRVYGPNGPSNPYIIRSHAEDRSGASVQSLMPLEEYVTTIQVNPFEKAMTIHVGKAVANIDDEKACRTKLAVEVKAERILENWRWGWHRVTFYGDWSNELKNLARLMGFKVYEEDK
jgi:L-fucose isomerase-like protein